MLERLWSIVTSALGLRLAGQDLGVVQMSLRAFVVFVLATAMIRVGDKRFMGKSTALDVMLGIVFGSVVSRAITGGAPFFPTLAAGFVLVLAHWGMSSIAFRSHGFGRFVKGSNRPLVIDGQIQWDEMKRAHVSEHDLYEAIRHSGHPPNVGRVKLAHLERDGEISVVYDPEQVNAG